MSKELAALVDRCLSRASEERPPDGGALRAALGPLLEQASERPGGSGALWGTLRRWFGGGG